MDTCINIIAYLGFATLLLTPVALCLNAARTTGDYHSAMTDEERRAANYKNYGPGSGRFWPPL